MPHKLAFKVVQFSSEDRNMHARDLLHQGPGVRGWACSRYGLYPQELILQLAEQSNLTKLQLLAHQHLIPEKIEIYIGAVQPGKDDIYYNASFAFLGYVALSDNAHTDFKARELKSVNVSCTGSYLKLVFHKNHMNKLNVHNQVALVAINILGNEVEDNNNSVSPDGDGRVVPSKGKAKTNAPLDQDLAFSMYVDVHVAETIKKMEAKKAAALKDERVEYAKKLEAAIEYLRKAGEKLGKYEIEKRHAIDNENFDKAKLKKKQLEEQRIQVYKQLNVDDLLEIQGERIPKNDKPGGGVVKELPESPQPSKPASTPGTSSEGPKSRGRTLPPARPNHSPSNPPPSPPRSPSPPPIKTPSAPLPGLGTPRHNLTPTSTPRPRSKRVFVPSSSAHNPPTPSPTAYTDYDERQLPALKHRSTQESPEDSTSSAKGGRRTSLTEVEKKDAELPLQIFEASLVEKFYSKNYSEKERGLLLLQEELNIYSYDATGIRSDRYTRAVVTLIRRALRDKVYTVAIHAAQTLSQLLNDFFIKHRVSKKEIAYTFEKVLPDLLAKTADNAQRTQNLAVSAIIEMLAFSVERGVGGVGNEITKPLSQAVHPRSALCRATIIETQLNKLKASALPKDKETGFTVKQLVEFGLSALQHQNSDVRKVGERLLVKLYHHYPVAVRKALPLEDEPARRNVLFRNLFEQLEDLDKKRQAAKKHQKSAATTPQYQQQAQPFPEFQQAAYQGVYTSTPGGSSTSSGFSTGSSAGGGDRGQNNVPVISITPDEAEARGRTLSRLNSSKSDLREEDEGDMMSPGDIDDKTCIFCGKYDESFFGTGLDLHYWKSCPLLTRCTYCKQVVEISALSQHFLGECDSAPELCRCERCTEPIPKFEIQRHVISAKCTAAKPPPLANHCPLCHENIAPWDDGWRQHLMPGPNACPANPRAKPPGSRKNRCQSNGKMTTRTPTDGKRMLESAVRGYQHEAPTGSIDRGGRSDVSRVETTTPSSQRKFLYTRKR